MTTFERIKKLAAKRHLTLVEVNDKANLGTRTIYHWKNKQPNNNNLAAVAKVLNTTTDYLLGTTDDPNIPENGILTTQELDRALDEARSFDGVPINEQDRAILKGMIKAYFDQKGND